VARRTTAEWTTAAGADTPVRPGQLGRGLLEDRISRSSFRQRFAYPTERAIVQARPRGLVQNAVRDPPARPHSRRDDDERSSTHRSRRLARRHDVNAGRST